MDVKSAKALDDQKTISVSLKRKRASQCAAYFASIAGQKLSANEKHCHGVYTTGDRCFKRIKLGGFKNDSLKSSCMKKYTNFLTSSSPQRLMVHENGAWKDVPDTLKTLARESFEAKKAITEKVVFQGHRLIFDFLRMVQIDLTGGLQLPLAWIDDSDVCFFPELGEDGCRGIEQTELKDPNGSCEIKVHIEIDISCQNEMKSVGKECGLKSPLIQIDTKPEDAVEGNEHDIGINSKLASKVIGENTCLDASSSGLVKLAKCGKDYIISQKMFLGGFGPRMDPNNVYAIYRSPIENISMQNRFKLFQKQVETTENCRGSANVKYGWLACSMQVAKEILNHGIGDKFKEPLYGGGVVFRPSNCSQLSASNSDVDENGLHHLVLCRIIMGKMEVVSPGSEQFRPSSGNFDSGVDNFKDTKLYVVWNMNVNMHVFPEYIVSFRMSLHSKEMFSNGSKSGISVVTGHTAQLERTHSHLDSVGSCQQFSSPAKNIEAKTFLHRSLKNSRLPASPWMPFQLLIAAISNKIAREDKKLVDQYYSEYQGNSISRMELIRRLRIVVGDKLLKSTILSLQHKVVNKPSVSRGEPTQKVE